MIQPAAIAAIEPDTVWRRMLYSLRQATDADRAWLDELRRAAYKPLFLATWGRWDEVRHQRHFAATWQQGRIQLIEIDGQPIGMIQLLEQGDCVEVCEIQILPKHQNKGLGTQLLVEVVDRARQQGRDVILSTGLMNSGAHRLYERLGFEETERSITKVYMRCSTRER
ncbi:MAG: GNAT family N-acetyltransferase [Planctomycetota bacterium]